MVGCESPATSPPSTLRGPGHCPSCSCEVRASELPTFVKALPSDLDEENVCFLRRKGALEIPDLPLRSALVRGYIENLHPWMPFLDLDLVFGSLQASPGSDTPRISVLLLQALMFAGSASCDLAELKRVGFSSRREARKAYFERVRVGCSSLTYRNSAKTEIIASVRL